MWCRVSSSTCRSGASTSSRPRASGPVLRSNGSRCLVLLDPRHRLGPVGQILDPQREAHLGRVDQAVALAAVAAEPGAQRLMPGHQRVQRPAERVPVQLAGQLQRLRHVIGLAGPGQLAKEPQPLLGEGQRQPAGPVRQRLDQTGPRGSGDRGCKIRGQVVVGGHVPPFLAAGELLGRTFPGDADLR